MDSAELDAENGNLLIDRNTRYEGRSKVEAIGSSQVGDREISWRSEQNPGTDVGEDCQISFCNTWRFYEHRTRVAVL